MNETQLRWNKCTQQQTKFDRMLRFIDRAFETLCAIRDVNKCVQLSEISAEHRFQSNNMTSDIIGGLGSISNLI